jgi:hypothetical protein
MPYRIEDFDWEYYLIENESLFNKILLTKEEAL